MPVCVSVVPEMLWKKDRELALVERYLSNPRTAKRQRVRSKRDPLSAEYMIAEFTEEEPPFAD